MLKIKSKQRHLFFAVGYRPIVTIATATSQPTKTLDRRQTSSTVWRFASMTHQFIIAKFKSAPLSRESWSNPVFANAVSIVESVRDGELEEMTCLQCSKQQTLDNQNNEQRGPVQLCPKES